MSKGKKATDPPAVEHLLKALTGNGSEPGDLQECGRQICQVAMDLFSADLTAIFAVNPITGAFLDPVSCGEPLGEDDIEFESPRDNGLTKRVLRDDEVISTDLVADNLESSITKKQGIRSVAAVALKIPKTGQSLAAVFIDFRSKKEWSDEERNLLRLFSLQASQRLQAVWFLRRYRTVSRAGKEVNEKLQRPEKLVMTLEGHLRDVLETGDCFLLALGRPTAKRATLYGTVQGDTVNGREVVLGDPYYRLLRQTRTRALRPREISERSEGDRVGLANAQSVMVAPLFSADEPLGLLIVQHSRPDVYGSEDVHLFQLLANHVALACSNQRLFKVLRRLSNAGQVLTGQLKTEEDGKPEVGGILQRIVHQIRRATEADVVVLYSYLERREEFVLPQVISGELLEPTAPEMKEVRPEDIAWRSVRKGRSVFAEHSSELFELLGGEAGERNGDFETREKVRSTAALPLSVAGETIGVLFINYREAQPFDEIQRYLIRGLARYAAIGIKHARTFRQHAGRPLQELDIFLQVDRILSQSIDLDEVLKRILELACEAVRPDEASILLLDTKTGRLKTRAAVGQHRDRSRQQEFLLADEKSISLAALRENRTQHADDVRVAPWNKQFVSIGARTISELAVPIQDEDGRSLGVMNFESRRRAAFSDDDRRFLEQLAGQATLAVQRAQDHEEVSRLSSEMQALIELGDELVRTTNERVIHERIVDRALSTTKATAGVLVLTEPGTDELRVVAEKGVPDEVEGRYLPANTGIIAKAARDNEVISVPDVREPPWSDHYVEVHRGTVSELAVPIVDGHVRGVINIESPTRAFFADRDVQLVRALADLALLAIQSAERIKRADKRGERLAALYALGQEVIAQRHKPDNAMKTVVSKALEVTQADFADLDLYDKDMRQLRVFGARRGPGGRIEVVDPSSPEQDQLHLKRGLMLEVARTLDNYRTPLGEDVQDHERYEGSKDIHSELIVGLKKGEDTLVLNVESRAHADFDSDDEEFLELLAAQAVIAIENAERSAQAARERERFEYLFEAGRTLARVRDMGELERAYQAVLEVTRGHWEGQSVIRRFIDAKLVCKAVARPELPPPFEVMSPEQGLNGYVARQRPFDGVVVADILNPPSDLPIATPSNPNDRSFVVAPIYFDRTCYGTLALSHERTNYFAGTDVELVKGLARQLGLTINRLEGVALLQEKEREAQEERLLTYANNAAVQVMHRLGTNIGWIPNALRRQSEDENPQERLEPLEQLHGRIEKAVDALLKKAEAVVKALSEGKTIQRMNVSAERLLLDARDATEIPERVDVLFEAAPNDLLEVRVSYEGMIESLLNLMDNAVKAMPEGGSLALGASRNEGWVEMRVSDTGVGIPKDKIDQIYHLGEGRQGGGFGLAHVWRNVNADLGEIVLKSEVGKGTTFTIRIPAARPL